MALLWPVSNAAYHGTPMIASSRPHSTKSRDEETITFTPGAGLVAVSFSSLGQSEPDLAVLRR